jgi:putative ATPase
MKNLGYGSGYQYPHDYEGQYVVENYLPEGLRSEKFYEPTDSGFEAEHKEKLAGFRAQKAPKEPGEDG